MKETPVLIKQLDGCQETLLRTSKGIDLPAIF